MLSANKQGPLFKNTIFDNKTESKEFPRLGIKLRLDMCLSKIGAFEELPKPPSQKTLSLVKSTFLHAWGAHTDRI